MGVVLESGVQAGRNLPPSPQKEVNMTQQISIKENDELKNILNCEEGTIRNYLWNTMNKDKLIELIILLVKAIRKLKQVLDDVKAIRELKQVLDDMKNFYRGKE